MTPQQLETLLSQPDFYPHPVQAPIQRIETHISTVWLTGETAYKIKKSVDFGFVDFSTREKRCHFCQREVALNRRFAPDIYRQTAWITSDGILPHPPDPHIDHECAVVMRQFDPEHVLSRYLKAHPLRFEQWSALGKTLAQFHLHAESAPKDTPWGRPDSVLQPMLDNFPVLYQHLSAESDTLRQLEQWTRNTCAHLHDALLQRRHHGHIRACHGDLHLDNIVLLDGVPTPFDGIEFNEQFRWIDPISDLSFLLISLDHIGQPVAALWLLHIWLQETGDDEAIPLLRFYGTYRALVRAKIATLQALQHASRSNRHQQLLEEARAFIRTAERWSLRPPRPTLTIMQGIAGSGKSYRARQLAQSEGAVIISSDIERKRLAGLPPLHRPTEEERAELYSPEMSIRTYRRLLNVAEKLLRQHVPVILDATYLKAEYRAAPKALAQSLNVPFRTVKLTLDPERCRENIRRRRARGDDPSDADENIMEWQLKIYEE